MKSRGYFPCRFLLLFILEGIALVILLEKLWSVNILEGFPGVVAFGVSLPFHKVLERSRPPMTSVVDQVFYLVLFCPLNEVGGRFREIRAVDGVFSIWD